MTRRRLNLPLMLTWTLWNAMKHPPVDSPIFRRAAQRVQTFGRRAGITLVIALVVFYAVLLLSAHLLPALKQLFFVISLAIPAGLFLLIYGSIAYGTLWTSAVSVEIASERESGAFDLLCLSPPGPLGAAWALGTGCLNRDQALQRIADFQPVGSWRGPLLVGVLIIFVVLSSPEREERTVQILYLIALLPLFYFDYVQSAVMSILVGMSIPTIAPTRLDARLWASGAFLFLKISIYLLFAGAMLALPRLFDALAGSEWYVQALLPPLYVALFYLFHEIIIDILWWLLARRLNAEAKHPDAALIRAIPALLPALDPPPPPPAPKSNTREVIIEL